MIDYDTQLVDALKTVLPTYEDRFVTSKTPMPCISYAENNNADVATGDTIEYSRITYQITVWATEKKDIKKYARLVDRKLKPLGWGRISAGELSDKLSAVRQKIMYYEALALEDLEDEE